MIWIFNGHKRGLGDDPSKVTHINVDVTFRDSLHHFKGAQLAVFMAIALHIDEDGWCFPGYERLSQETGYNLDTVRRALRKLCKMKIDDHRVLLRYQPRKPDAKNPGQFGSNRYLIFPTKEDVAKYEGQGITHLGHATGGGFKKAEPSRENTVTVKNRNGKNAPSRRAKTPPLTSTIEQAPPDDDDGSDLEEAINALLERGWTDTEGAAIDFIQTWGISYTLAICAHAREHGLGAGWIRKNAGKWRPSNNGNNKREERERRRKYGQYAG
jgi:hypothetical protein